MHKTALHADHLKLGAKMTEFHGWEMPLYYTSILEEHKSVRTAVGLFDISHMGQVRVSGSGALETLNELVVSDLANVGERRACYTLVLNERGGIIDDVIVYHLSAQEYLVIVNCSNRLKDYEWLVAHRRGTVAIQQVSEGRSILAVQGPQALRLLEDTLEEPIGGLGRFDVAPLRTLGDQVWIARTGYTGSDGFELFLPDQQGLRLWRLFLARGHAFGVQPIGLGARDTLRLEAGLRLYGSDLDETTSPYEADLSWTVAIHKPSFLGKEALIHQKANVVSRRLVGFELAEGPMPRHGTPLLVEGRQVGTVTSGTFSMLLNKPIGMGYVEASLATPGTRLSISVRGKRYVATVVKLPFWRAEQAKAELRSTVA